ncbi:MAG: prepilin-type N-terminal cleavage/methylation domain-containing protein [Gemmatimonadaceae bacterium]
MRGSRAGFTLIEVLVVLVVLGILSGIAIAKYLDTKDAAYVASMKPISATSLCTSRTTSWTARVVTSREAAGRRASLRRQA